MTSQCVLRRDYGYVILLGAPWQNATSLGTSTTETYHLPVLEIASPRSRCWQGCSFFLAVRRPPSRRVLTWSVLCTRTVSCLILFFKGHWSCWRRASPVWPHSTWITSLKALSPNPVTFWSPGVQSFHVGIWVWGCDSAPNSVWFHSGLNLAQGSCHTWVYCGSVMFTGALRATPSSAF